MKRFFTIGLLASSMLATPAQASEIRDLIGPVMAQAPDAATIDAKCQAQMAQIALMRDAIIAETGPATVETTLQAYDDLNALLIGAGSEFTLYRQVMLDEERRGAGEACEVALNNIYSELSLSRPIYDRLAQIDASAQDAETQAFLTKTLAGYQRSGVALDDAGRARVQAINEELSGISAEISRNIAEDVRSMKVTPAELAGVPQDFIDGHELDGDGMITITTAYTDYQPVMRYATSDDLRRRFSILYAQRAFPANEEPLRRMFTLRNELALLLGRPNFATLALEDKMLDTPEKVEELLAEIAQAANPAAARDYAMNMEVLREYQPDAQAIEYWQTGWLSPLVQERNYDYDPQEARRYFYYDNVRDGVIGLAEDLFNVTIRQWDTPLWADGVEAYEMLEGDTVIGQFYLDSHPRPGKYTHGNAIPLRTGVVGDEPPVGALVMNLPEGDQAMEHNDVVTFLHEFGHLIHFIFGSNNRWASQHAFSVEWDFVEAPSQMLENWLYDYDTLATFARDRDGNTIPRDLVKRMNRARVFNQGMGNMTQVGLSKISLNFHQRPLPDNLGAATREWMNEYALVPYPDFVEMQAAFNHLDNYSAYYYTYRWSVVIADDMFQQFAQNGLRDPETADRYRRLVLQPGGTRPTSDLVHDFLGRAVTLDAFKAKLEDPAAAEAAE